jgi:hypothetical protein
MEKALRYFASRYATLLPNDAIGYADHVESRNRFRRTRSSRHRAATTAIASGRGGGTPRDPPSSSSHSSHLGDRSNDVSTLRERLEAELDTHVNNLVDLLSSSYESSDASHRGSVRRWMGGWLRIFAYGGGAGGTGTGGRIDDALGASFESFCPGFASSTTMSATSTTTAKMGAEGGGTMGTSMGPVSITDVVGGGGGVGRTNPLGMENTSACGVEGLLRVLLRIVMGFRAIDDMDDGRRRRGTSLASPTSSGGGIAAAGARRSTILRPSHERLLFDVLVPLHRPAGMVLWRDQTPLIGLYHETLTKNMGALLCMDRTLVGQAIGALLHPDIWPIAEGGNTPKVVLLLHEADDLVGLLSTNVNVSQGARGGANARCGEDDAHYLASFDPHLVPLVSRLCACISSENSRTSERALQFFKNDTFKRLVRRRLNDVGHLFMRALCRCPTMDVPWNPTVRKMTLLVVSHCPRSSPQ